MPKVVFGFRKGSRLDFRNVNEQDRPESPFKFPDEVNGEQVSLVISWHGFLVYDIRVDIAAAMAEFMRYISSDGCCGRCVAGKNGTAALAAKLLEIRENPTYEGLNSAIELAENIRTTSKCSLAPSSVKIVISFLKEFPDQLHKNTMAQPLNYYHHLSAPCTAACPANVRIPEFIDDIRSKRFLPALSTIRETLPLPGLCGRVCPHPCEKACLRGEIDEPVNIMALKQSAWNYEYYKQQPPVIPPKKEPSGKMCAIIGAGPAGLTAAYYLALAGHRVDIFDMLSEPGGMAAVGIPDFRQPRKLLAHEVNIVRSLGVNIHCGRTLGKDITIKYLKDTYDSVLIAVGAWKPQESGIADSAGVYGVEESGIGFLREAAEGRSVIQKGEKVVVVGGGNTAIDCARTALRFGAQVSLLYRRSRDEMPAEAEESADAEAEGVRFMMLTAPVRAVSENEKLIGLECVKMRLGSPDATGRRSPEVVFGSNFIVPCDRVIPAIGQKSDLSFISADDGIEVSKWSTIKTSEIFHNTGLPGFFAAGDCISGPNTVVRAVGSGRWAAKMMDRYMMKGKIYLEPEEVIEQALYENKIFEYGEDKESAPVSPRNNPEKIPMEERLSSFNEINVPFSDITASREAKRCLRCMRVGMFGTQKKAERT